ncbi:23440_t:CDS:2, partial [Gigaspora rosea]
MLLQKPSLTNEIWKSLAFGLFSNLQEFSHKNMMDNIKHMGENTILQTTDAYMDAVLVLYENREQELNAYRDYINELYIKHNFTAVLGYDKDRRIALIMNQNIMLLDQNIEAEGKNFDSSTTKKLRNEVGAQVGLILHSTM